MTRGLIVAGITSVLLADFGCIGPCLILGAVLPVAAVLLGVVFVIAYSVVGYIRQRR
jgi:hypothetical protein